METSFFTLKEVLELHQGLLSRYGGLDGIRDLGALEAALTQPGMEVFGQTRFTTPPEQAGAYLYFVIKAHAFSDGNKRTAATLCLSWLEKHGWMVFDDAFYALTLWTASEKCRVEDVISRLREIIVRF